MMAKSHIRHFSECQVFIPPFSTYSPNHDQTRMYPYTQSELDAFVLLQTGRQVFHHSEDTQARSYRSLGIIFMGLGIAEVHQESIPQELSKVTVIASNHLSTGGLIRTDHV